MTTAFVGARSTRSGRVFNPWSPAAPTKSEVEAIRVAVDFSTLLEDAIDEEISSLMQPTLDDDLDDPADDIHVMPLGDFQKQAPPEAGPSSDEHRGKNHHRHGKRKRKHDETIAESGHIPKKCFTDSILDKLEAIPANLDARHFPAAKNAYSARRAIIPDAKKVYTPKDLDSMGFRKVAYSPGKIRAVVDQSDRIISCFVDKPYDSSWDASCMDVHDEMRREHDEANLRSGAHTRGAHVAINIGNLMGQGQTEPTPLRLGACAALTQRLVGRESTIRLATYTSAAFNVWAPRLHLHFREGMASVLEARPHLSPNFLKSVYPAACFNTSRCVACFKHRDILNVPYGWCAITALGRFDHTRGAHLILWDLKLYFEFPHGCTMYIPSASIVHSNTPIASPATEERTSFTQYFPGAILRWIDNGFVTDRFLKLNNPEKLADLARWKKERWEKGLAMYSTFTEILDSLL